MSKDTRKKVGEVVLHFLEDDEGTWYSELQELDEKKCQGDLRTIYKLALISAVLQDTLRTKLPAMDALIKTNQEIQKIHNELVAEKNQTHKAWQQAMPAGDGDEGGYAAQPTTDMKLCSACANNPCTCPDTEKFQTKLPFEDDEEQRQAEMDDWADNGFDDGEE
jgi:hypothetical protein